VASCYGSDGAKLSAVPDASAPTAVVAAAADLDLKE